MEHQSESLVTREGAYDKHTRDLGVMQSSGVGRECSRQIRGGRRAVTYKEGCGCGTQTMFIGVGVQVMQVQVVLCCVCQGGWGPR